MSDLIDRQAAIDAVQRHREGVLGGYEYDEGVAFVYAAAHNHIIDVIKQLPSAQPERSWIPVSERLPERYWDVLVTVKEKYKDEEQYRYHADVAEHFEGNEWCTNNDWDEGQEVEITAWMPLPEPWKGEENA